MALGAAVLDARVGAVAAELGLSARVLEQPASTLSGGEAARVGLAALLLSRFDVYLLDEPTNDLDLDGLERLERWVLGNPAPMLIVSHDRRFLDRVITDVAEIDKHVRHFKTNQTEQLAAKAAQTKRAVDRLDVVDKPRKPWHLQLDIPAVARSGNIVCRLSHVEVRRGSFRLGPVDLLIEFGERLALVGSNGAGKSTLIDVIVGHLELLERVRLTRTLRLTDGTVTPSAL